MIRLLAYIAGIYICFLTWGLTQERVSTTLYDNKKFDYFVFLNTLQALVASIIAYIYILLEGKGSDKMPRALMYDYLKISVLSCLASPFGYASLKHIDYPTLILGKTCKLVPVLLMNFILFRKIFPLKKYIVVFLITAGMALFMLLDPKKHSKKETTSSLYGLGLLSINLLLDGAYNSTQDQVFRTYKVGGNTMMMYMNFYSFLIMSIFLIINPFNNELQDAIQFCLKHPAIISDILLFCVAGSLGQVFIFLTLHAFGSLVLVTVTVTRKMFSILLSVIWFGHHLTLGQWGSVGLVFAAIAYDSAGKSKSNASDKTKKE
jgi:solute carrier family 35 (UDP-galactose transporter), member B1